MKTLREKIEALTRFANGPRSVEFVKLYDVLRIVAEHEQALSGAVVIPVLPTNAEDDRLMDEMINRVNELRTARTLLDLTPGGPVKTAPPVGQAGGEPWRKGLPDVRLRRAWEFWECKLDGRWTSRLLEDRDLQLSKAGDYWRPLNKTWSEVEQMARDADGGAK